MSKAKWLSDSMIKLKLPNLLIRYILRFLVMTEAEWYPPSFYEKWAPQKIAKHLESLFMIWSNWVIKLIATLRALQLTCFKWPKHSFNFAIKIQVYSKLLVIKFQSIANNYFKILTNVVKRFLFPKNEMINWLSN